MRHALVLAALMMLAVAGCGKSTPAPAQPEVAAKEKKAPPVPPDTTGFIPISQAIATAQEKVPGGVAVLSPEGKHLGTICMGVTSNCAWGDDGSTLYVTADDCVWRVRTHTRGTPFRSR